MKTYEVTLRITTKYGDPSTWDWTGLLDGEQVTVQSTPAKSPVIRAYVPRTDDKTAILATVHGMQKPITTLEISKLTGIKPVVAARLVFELKHKGKLREVTRDESGRMLYEVA